MPFQPIGQLIKANGRGVLPRIGRAPHASWEPIVHDLIDQLGVSFGDTQFSLLTRGSVARGASFNEAADLDLVVVHGGQDALSDRYKSRISPDLKIETSFIPLNEFAENTRWAWMRFMLAHNGHTIAGPDVLADLPEPVLGRHSIAHLHNADKWLTAWQTYGAQDEDYQAICAWLMKRIVRSLFESQMIRINAFSRDIYPCAEVAMTAFPRQRALILRAAELAVAPVDDHQTVVEIAKPLSEILLAQQAELKLSGR